MIFFNILFFVGFFAANVHAEDYLTLSEALQKADDVNLQVMMANARVEQAIARIAQAQSDLLPHIDGIASAARQTTDLRAGGIQIPGADPHVGPYNSFNARARVSLTLIDLAAFKRLDAARKGEELSKAEVEKVREDILAVVANLFLEAQRQEQRSRLLKTLLDKEQMAYQLSQEGYKQGTATFIEAKKMRSNLDQARYVYHQAKLQAQEAILDLQAALQMPLNGSLSFLEDKVLIKKLEHSAGGNLDHAANADMALASARLEASKSDKKAADAVLFPKLSASADYGRLGQSPKEGSNTHFVGVQATVPIWEGGSQQARIKESKGRIKEAESNLRDATQQAQLAIARSKAAIVEMSYLKKAKAQQHQTAQKSLRLALQGQEVGSHTALDVMQAKTDLAMAEDEYNEAQAGWMMAHIDLLHAQGRLRSLIKKKGN